MSVPQQQSSTLPLISLTFGISVILRLVYLYESMANPLFGEFNVDVAWHAEWARDIVAGNWAEDQAFFRAPLYPFFLAASYWITGESFVGARVIQHLLGALTCVLTALIADRLAGRRVAYCAALIAALYGPLMFYENELLIACLSVFLLTTLLYWLTICAEQQQPWRLLIAGILLGLAAISRPNFLVLVPVICVWWFLISSQRSRAQLATQAAMFLCGLCLAISPVTIHNKIYGGQWVLIATQGGINFYIGNSEFSDGKAPFSVGETVTYGSRYEDHVRAGAEKVAEQRLGRELTEQEISSYWYGQGLQFWRDQPSAALALYLKKFYFLINGFEIESARTMYWDSSYSVVFAVLVWYGIIVCPFGIVLPLALVGWWYGNRSHPQVRLLLATAIVYASSFIPFFITGRFRIPIIPIVIVFAAWGLVRLYEFLRDKDYNRCAYLFMLLGAGVGISNSALFGVRELDIAAQASLMGFAHLHHADYESAASLFETALELEPDRFFERGLLGFALVQLQRYSAALPHIEQALVKMPDSAKLRYAYANALANLKRFDRASTQLQRVISEPHECPECVEQATALLQAIDERITNSQPQE